MSNDSTPANVGSNDGLGVTTQTRENLIGLELTMLKPEDSGFNRVYQGGHHDVWCNGSQHIYCTGGWAGKWPRQVKGDGPCNCDEWAAWIGQAPELMPVKHEA